VLGVKRLGEGEDAIGEQAAVQLAHDLLEALASRATADARVHINVSIRIDGVVIRARASGEAEVVGGPLLSFDQWGSAGRRRAGRGSASPADTEFAKRSNGQSRRSTPRRRPLDTTERGTRFFT
jgi:hypothetical protein